MAQMKEEDWQELCDLLDGRIDELTKPIPSKQILRFAEAIRSADTVESDEPATYGPEDYQNLIEARDIVSELLPDIIESIRVKSIHPELGWKFSKVEAGNGDHGLCAICEKPYQHFDWTVEVHHLDMHPNRYHGVCRDCVGQYAPVDFVDRADVNDWFQQNRNICQRKEQDNKRELQRQALIDKVREHAESAGKTYAADIMDQAPDWLQSGCGEWR